VANTTASSLSVIDTATNTVVATVPVGRGPQGVAVNPAGSLVYVTNNGSNTISIIDTATNEVTATVPVGVGPFGVAVNPAGSRVYVTSRVNNTVSVLDTATNRVIATVPVGNSPQGVAVNPAGTLVYVANRNQNTVSIIDTVSNTVVETVNVGTNPVAFGIFIGSSVESHPVETILSGLSTNISGAVQTGEHITFTVNSVGQSTAYYKFWYRGGYGTFSSATNPWLVIQDFSTNNVATFSFPSSDNYIVMIWAVADPNTIPDAVPFLGMNIRVNGSGRDVQFVNLSADLSTTPQVGRPIKFTAEAIGSGTIYYKFWYRAGYGTVSGATNPWLVMQDFSTNNAATFSFPSSDNYIVVVWGVRNRNNVDPSNVPIIGMNIKVE
jgi:YVTN family beta-propeller protein